MKLTSLLIFLRLSLKQIKPNFLEGESPTINEENRFELRNRTDFAIRTVNSDCNGVESLSYLGPKTRETLLLDLKQIK